MKTIDIHGKPYVMVKDRVIYFNGEYPNGCIKTKKLPSIDNIVIFEATIIPNIENPERYFTGHAEEEVGSSQINNTSALENCETSAVGRALAMMGIGADESFASADEVSNAVYQQEEADQTGMPLPAKTHNTPKTSKNGSVCPKCGGETYSNLNDDGQPKKSKGYNEKVKKGIKWGRYQQSLKCKTNCDGGGVWPEVDEEGELIQESPDLVDDDNYAEAVQIKQQKEEEELLF